MFSLKLLSFTVLLLFLTQKSESTIDLCEETKACIECICHALTSCREITQCALVSIDFEYWRTAENTPKAPELTLDEDLLARKTYNSCLNNETCVLHTILHYTDQFLDDINCDGDVNCADRFAVHLWGQHAKDSSKRFHLSQAKRFDRCIGHEENVTTFNQVTFQPEPNCVLFHDRIKVDD